MARVNEEEKTTGEQITISRSTARWALLAVGILALATAAVVTIIGLQPPDVKWIALAIGVGALAGAVLVDPQSVQEALTGRTARYASNSLLISLAVIAILVVGYILIVRYEQPIDLTEEKEYSLSPQTIELLEALEEPVHVVGFYTPFMESTKETSEIWLRQYKQRSDGMLTYEFVDPDLDPGRVRQLGMSRAGVLVFQQGDRTAEASLADERELTGALLRVQQGEPRRLYALTGHGERSLDDFSEVGYSQVRQALERENFEVETLNLFESGQVPEDADVVMVAGPTTQLAPQEVSALGEYVEAGGSLVVMVDPTITTGVFTSGVQGVDFSPDGERLVTASADDTAKVWDADSGDEIVTLAGHTGDVVGAAFSPDGDVVATASADLSVRLWDADSGEELAALEGHRSVPWRVAFSPDGERLVSGGQDQAAIIWDVESGQPLQVMTTQSPIFALAYSPTGEVFATGGQDGTIAIWDAESGAALWAETLHTDLILGLAFSSDGGTLLSAARDGTVGTIDVQTGEQNTRPLYPNLSITDVAYIDDERVALALADLSVRVWDAGLENELLSLPTGHTDIIWQIAVSPDGETLATVSGDGALKLWDLEEASLLRTITGHSGGDPLLTYLNEQWYVVVNDDLVVEPATARTFDEFTPIALVYGNSPITEPLLGAQLPTYFVAARSVAPSPEAAMSLSTIVTPLVQTSTQSWGETNPVAGATLDEADLPGPLSLAVSSEDMVGGGRLVVIGDADFASNGALQQEAFGNIDLFVNAANWLSEEEELLNLRPRSTGFRTFEHLSDPIVALIGLSGACLLPIVVGMAGVLVWVQRRARQ
jgi:WD40 repeat protein